jgi:hypothetical protein
MKTFDVILVTDTATVESPQWSRGYGAHRLASHLRVNGYSVLVIDFSSALEFDTWKQICDLAIGDNTKMVGFSTTWWPYRTPFKKTEDEVEFRKCNIEWMSLKGSSPVINTESLTYNAVIGNAQLWIDVVKSKNKKIKIVVGGPKIDWYLDFPADFFINGLGENQIIDLLSDNRRIWPKVIEHDINSNNRDWGWTACSTDYTKFDLIQPGEILNLEIARGCKFNCTFCSFPLIGQKDTAKYYKTEETIYKELLRNYELRGTTSYNIADDTFNDDNSKIEMMVRIVSRLPFKPSFFAYIRVDLVAINPKQIELLKEMGLVYCYIGVESFHPIASKFSGKGMAADKRKDTLHLMSKVWGDSVAVDVGYIVGLPGETEEYLLEQADWFLSSECFLNHYITFIALVINPKWSLKYSAASKIDLDPESFGYSIPDREKPNFWVKDDNTGINSYEHACRLADALNDRMNARPQMIPSSNRTATELDPVADYFIPLIEMLKHG